MAFDPQMHVVEGVQTPANDVDFVTDYDGSAPTTVKRFRVWDKDRQGAGVQFLEGSYEPVASVIDWTKASAAVGNIGTPGNLWDVINAVTGTFTGSVSGVNSVFTGFYRGGSATQAVAVGDGSWGDGTRTMFYDASGHVLGGTGGTFRAGTTSNDVFRFITNNTNRFQVQTTGHLIASLDDAYDIGNNATTFRPRHLYLSQSITARTYARTGTSVLATGAGDASFGLTGAAQYHYDQSAARGVYYNASGTATHFIQAGATTVWNNANADLDTQFKGTTNDNVLYVDAGLNHLGFGTTASSDRLVNLIKSWTITSGSGYGMLYTVQSDPTSNSTAAIIASLSDAYHRTAFNLGILRAQQLRSNTTAGFSAGTITSIRTQDINAIHGGAGAVTAWDDIVVQTATGSGAGVITTWTQCHLKDLSAHTVTNRIGFRQVGTNAHNRFNGAVTIGADAAPSARAHIIESTTAQNAMRVENTFASQTAAVANFLQEAAGAAAACLFLRQRNTAQNVLDASDGTNTLFRINASGWARHYTSTSANAAGEFSADQLIADTSLVVGAAEPTNNATLDVQGSLGVGAHGITLSNRDLAAGLSGGTTTFFDESAAQWDFEVVGTGNLGPIYRYYHNSSSPAADDVIARQLFDGETSTGATSTYVKFDVVIDDETNGAEEGHVEVHAQIASTLTEIVRFGASVDVKRAISLPIETISGATTLGTSHYMVLCDVSGGAFTVALPTAVGIEGRIFIIKKIDSSALAVTVDGNGTETIDGALTQVISTQHNSFTIHSDNANWRIS